MCQLYDLEMFCINADQSKDEIAAARPDIDEKTAQLVSKGRWEVPGYKVRLRQSRHCLIRCATSDTCIGEIWRSVITIDECYHFPFPFYSVLL
jgi:hypothetical protein